MATTVEQRQVPWLSLAERDRRWACLRTLMDRDGFDVIVTPPHTGHHDHFQANSRYVTGVGGGSAEVRASSRARARLRRSWAWRGCEWRGLQDWVTDLRSANLLFGDAIVARLRELGADRAARIAGLANIARYPEGDLPRHRCQDPRGFPGRRPGRRHVSAGRGEFVKSEEEIAFLARAVELVEAAIDVMAREARPGRAEARGLRPHASSMVRRRRATHDDQLGRWAVAVRPLWHADAAQAAGGRHDPERDRGRAGQATSARASRPAILGRVTPEYATMFAIQQAALDRCYDLMRPVPTVDDLIRVSEEAAQGTPYVCRIITHGRGLGDDLPIRPTAARTSA